MAQREKLKAMADMIAVIGKYRSKEQQSHNATDEEVVDFIQTFFEPASTTLYGASSYGWKHVAEKAIGYMFCGLGTYCYVSNEQFKRCMKECGFLSRKTKENPENEYYFIKYRPGMKEYAELVMNYHLYNK